jgi:hypothetical protein
MKAGAAAHRLHVREGNSATPVDFRHTLGAFWCRGRQEGGAVTELRIGAGVFGILFQGLDFVPQRRLVRDMT